MYFQMLRNLCDSHHQSIEHMQHLVQQRITVNTNNISVVWDVQRHKPQCKFALRFFSNRELVWWCIKYSSWRNFTQGVNKMHCSAVTASCWFFAGFGHRCFPEHLIIKKRPPDNFNYSHNLKIYQSPRSIFSWGNDRWTPGVAEYLMLPWSCFTSLFPKPSLLCLSVVFFQDCLRLPNQLICIPSCIATLHLWALPIYSLCSCAFCHPRHSSLSTAHVSLFLSSALSKHPPTLFLQYAHLSFFCK